MNRYRYSDSTLKGTTKEELIKYVRMCEYNQDVAEESLAQQYENVKDWQPVVHGKWIYEYQNTNDNWVCHCSNCEAGDEHATDYKNKVPYCWNCGAKMDKED